WMRVLSWSKSRFGSASHLHRLLVVVICLLGVSHGKLNCSELLISVDHGLGAFLPGQLFLRFEGQMNSSLITDDGSGGIAEVCGGCWRALKIANPSISFRELNEEPRVVTGALFQFLQVVESSLKQRGLFLSGY